VNLASVAGLEKRPGLPIPRPGPSLFERTHCGSRLGRTDFGVGLNYPELAQPRDDALQVLIESRD
jgi:hypothetical protein